MSELDSQLIQAVVVVSLRKVINERGHLLEIQRNDESVYPGFGQAYITATKPSVVKAWYLHHNMTDQIAIISGNITLAMYDSRSDSSTHGSTQVLRMHEDSPSLVQIPPGVWHGFRADSSSPALLMHLNTMPWNETSPDEDRLPVDTDEIPFTW